ncbi:hypothetical protein N9C66_10715, partial [Akkermansiaceae bacterium]|nr:hypothetical protein [Akkermansiaceae bacterium]MDA9831796.1 hypothetical protein [Akkermansiaceae bacterium]MDB4465867.1 hypothetical protein [Akkermansiaceae bacterium]
LLFNHSHCAGAIDDQDADRLFLGGADWADVYRGSHGVLWLRDLSLCLQRPLPKSSASGVAFRFELPDSQPILALLEASRAGDDGALE